MKGEIYGNRLPRGRQVKKKLGTAAIDDIGPDNYSSKSKALSLALWRRNFLLNFSTPCI